MTTSLWEDPRLIHERSATYTAMLAEIKQNAKDMVARGLEQHSRCVEGLEISFANKVFSHFSRNFDARLNQQTEEVLKNLEEKYQAGQISDVMAFNDAKEFVGKASYLVFRAVAHLYQEAVCQVLTRARESNDLNMRSGMPYLYIVASFWAVADATILRISQDKETPWNPDIVERFCTEIVHTHREIEKRIAGQLNAGGGRHRGPQS